MNQRLIQALKKMDNSYNIASLNYINKRFKDMKIENTSQGKTLIY